MAGVKAASVNAARQLALLLSGCALILTGASAAEVVPSAPQPHSPPESSARSSAHGRAVGVNSSVIARQARGVVRPPAVHAGSLRSGIAGTAKFAAGAHPLSQPLAMRAGPNRSTAPLTAMARSAVVGGPRTQERGTLGGPASSSSAIRTGSVQGGISGTTLRRRF